MRSANSRRARCVDGLKFQQCFIIQSLLIKLPTVMANQIDFAVTFRKHFQVLLIPLTNKTLPFALWKDRQRVLKFSFLITFKILRAASSSSQFRKSNITKKRPRLRRKGNIMKRIWETNAVNNGDEKKAFVLLARFNDCL